MNSHIRIPFNSLVAFSSQRDRSGWPIIPSVKLMMIIPNTRNESVVIHNYRIAFTTWTPTEIVIANDFGVDSESFCRGILATFSRIIYNEFETTFNFFNIGSNWLKFFVEQLRKRGYFRRHKI